MKILLIGLALLATTINANSLKTTQITIKHSLYADAKKQGLHPKTIRTISRELSWKINFNTLRKNDKFVVVGSRKNKPDAIIYKRKNKSIKAFLWGGQYFDKNGNSLHSGFLKSPVKYKRISSKFQYRRYHPILKTYLPHRAVDYAADFGTSVYAAADGVIEKRKNIGVLGNAVFIKHGDNYQTVYAHLSRFARGLYVGKRVKKGRIIGYVGSSGRSTGPHLHYEIRHHNKRKNPLKTALPKPYSVKKSQLQAFKNQVRYILRLK